MCIRRLDGKADGTGLALHNFDGIAILGGHFVHNVAAVVAICPPELRPIGLLVSVPEHDRRLPRSVAIPRCLAYYARRLRPRKGQRDLLPAVLPGSPA